jgi:formiminoglutamase
MNKINLIKVPLFMGGLGKTNGVFRAPDTIINFFNDRYFNNDKKIEIIDVEIDNSNCSFSYNNIYEQINKLIKSNLDYFNVVLGGDHSITYSSFKAFSENYNNSGIIIFDAHPDLMFYTDIHTHEDYLRKLIDDKHLKKENIILIGIRNIDPIERDFLKNNNIKYFTPEDIFNLGIETICDELMAKAKTFDNLYISIDIDVLDPSFCPGTNYLEPFGLSTNELLYFLRRLKFLNKIRMFDIVEVDPKIDFNNITSITAAKILSYILNNDKKIY